MIADTSGGVRKMEYFMRRSRWEAATIKYGEKEESEIEWASELQKSDGGRQKEKRMRIAMERIAEVDMGVKEVRGK